jgi:hypothetical protein
MNIMNFKTGDFVVIKGSLDISMSVMGFLGSLSDEITSLSQDSINKDWVVCQYQLKNGTFAREVFHKDQLELDDNVIDGGRP